MKTETMHNVTVDQVTQKYDGQNNLVKESREELFAGRMGGVSKFIAAYKALKEVDVPVDSEELDLDTLEVAVDGSPFCG